MRYEDASLSGSFQDQGPVARDDAEQLAAGERGPATGNVISGAGTQSGAAGADTAAGAQIVAVSGAGGNDSSADGGRFRVEGEHGTLSLTPRGDFSYNARAGVPENSRDVFTYTLGDSAGATSQARLLIEIGKTPAVVKADAQRIVPGPDGVVVLPAGVELSDVRVVGRDLLIMLPDGTQMLIVDGAVFVPQLVINDIEVPSTNLAALLIEQEPRPASGVPQSSGGNFIEEVGPLDPGTPLGDLLPPTELEYIPPEFVDVGLEDDREPETGANALIQMDDDARPGGNAGGTGDDPDAVNVTGTLAGSGGDGPLTFAFNTAGAPAGFTYAVNANGALVVSQGGTVVLTVTLNAQTGAYSVTQNAPVNHAPGENENNLLFTFNYTVTDRDGDQAAGTVQLNLDDDTPVVDVVAGADAGIILQTDDADTRGEGTDIASSEANFGGVFTLPLSSVGADGLGSAGAISYALGTPGGASGLTQSGSAINLFLIGGKVVGSTAASAGAVTTTNTVFDLSLVGTNGVVRLTQYSQVDHGNTDPSPTGSPFSDQIVRLADGLVTLTASASISDRDGDTVTDSVVVAIGDNIRFTDDGPSLTGAEAGAGVLLDETDARSGFPITASSNGAVITGSGVNFGADGQAAQGAATYAISILSNGATSLRTAVGDFPITLSQAAGNNNVITGTYDGGKVAFTVTINADGSLTVRQSVALEHDVDGNTAAAYDDSLSLAGLINATVTIRDFDGDTAQASAAIGDLVTFKDDGPDSSLAVGAARPTLTLDETLPLGNDTAGASAPGGLATVTAGFAGMFATAAYGADGAGSTAYALVLNGQNVASGLFALQVGDTSANDGDPLGRGQEILLNQSGNTITGSVGEQAMFTIVLNPQTGEITFTQLQAVWNPTGGTSYDEAAVLSAAANALVLRQTVTDSDGDFDSTDIDLGTGVFQIQDDGPRANPDAGGLSSSSTAPATGNVLANDSQGRDGATVFLVDALGQPTTTLTGQYGVLTLNANGDYSYVRTPGTPGGVDDVFTYVLRDTDGDTASATLTISIGNLTPTVNVPAVGTPGTIVEEAALGERGAGESQGSAEQLASGANGDTREATSGTITFTQGDGPADIRINGVLVTGVNQMIDTGEGILRVDTITAGSIGYTYTLKDNVLVSGPSSPDVIAVSVTDKDGEVASTNLTITIVNDRPDAIDDVDEVAAGSYALATGNVLTGIDAVAGDANGSDGVADIQGADGARVVAVSGVTADDSFDASGNLTVNGLYGVLTLKADGSYSYARNPQTPGGVEDVFTYTLRDNDGDQDTAKLTIRIGNLPPTVNAPDAGADGTIVYEAALGDRGAGESQGSSEELVDGADGDKREATSGVITFNQGDGPAEISIGGVVVTGVNQVIDTGEGSLRIDAITAGSISYTYTLKDNVLVSGASSPDVITVTVKDADGQIATDDLIVSIRNDAPDAKDDVDLVGDALAPATGNVITGIDRVGGDINSSDGTRDVQGADGAVLSQVASNNLEGAAVAVAADGTTVIQGQYGALTVNKDGSYSYLRFDSAPLDADDVFTYTLRDNDGDSDTAKLTIQIRDTGVVVNIPGPGGASTTVFEQGLPERAGEPAGSGEIADGNGTDNDDQSEAVSGTVTFTAKDGVGSITIGTATLNLAQPFAQQTIADDATGKLVVTSYSFNAATGQGTIGYTYTLKDNTSGDSTSASFALVVKDVDGDQNGGNLVIAIRDDAPDAIADRDSIEAGGYGPATGNVITGTDKVGGDANATDGSRDVQGADGASVVFVRGVNSDSSFDEAGNLVVNGLYGVLSIKADGSYTYNRNPGTAGGVEDVFTYRLQDGDGDQDEATLTITIGNLPPQVNAPDANAEGTIVFEKGLGLPDTRQPGDSLGSGEEAAAGDNGDPSEATSGSITYSSGDGPAVIRIDNVVVTGVNQVIDTGPGLLTITSLTSTTIGYSYVLKDNLLVSGEQTEDVIAVSVTDKDNQVASDTLTIVIKDDAPVAADDLDLINSANLPATGNVITGIDRVGGDANATDGVKDVQGADGAFVSAVASNNLESEAVTVAANGDTLIQGQYGTLTISKDGSYSYSRTNGDPVNGEDRFTYTLQDNDGDTDTAVLTIQISDNGVTTTVPTTGAGTEVDEKGLPARGSEPAGSGESANPSVDDNSEITTGTITFVAKDGWASVSLSGLVITPGTAFPTAALAVDKGSLVINSLTFDAATGVGSISYTYTLGDNTSGDNTTAVLPLTVTDSDGDSSSKNLVIAIKDDVPTANLDTDSVSEGGTTGGNVVLGTGAVPDNAAGKDVLGADGAQVVGVQKGDTGVASTASVATEIAGSYGKLTLNADGSYTYKADANVVPTGQVLEDVFTYTIRDGDGDVSFTTLTIKVNDVTLPADNQTGQVLEAALDTSITGDDIASGTAIGSDPASPFETATGDINVTGATEYVLTGGTNNVIDSPLGKITLNATTGEWVYTLIRPASNVSPNTESVTETFNYVAKDAAGNSVPGTIIITIVDDVPTARDDLDRVTEGLGNTAEGNVLLGTGATPNTADGKDVIGADNVGTVIGARTGLEPAGGAFTGVPAGAGGTLVSGTYGDLLIKADGSYTYTLKTASIPTNVGSETFSYQMKDGDGDTSVAQLTINFDQDLRVPAIGNSTVTVFEDGLADGLQHGANSEFSPTGSFTVNFNGETGGKAFIGSTELVTGAQVTTAKGVLTIGTITTAGNVTTYSYSYELKAAQTHAGAGESSPANDVLDTFTVEARDPTGDISSPNGTITVRIVDDIPVANDDAYEILEGDSDNKITFDVDTNDQNGADGFQSREFVTLTGTYGSLTLNPDGTQTYTLSTSGQAALNALGTGQTLIEKFNYTLKDGDNDTDPAEVVVTLRGTDDPVTITNLTPTAEGGDAMVDEDDLPAGSDTTKESTTGTGDFNISAPDGVATVKVGSFDLFVNGVFQVNSGGTTPLGNTIRFTAYDPATGKISYTYTLNAAENHAAVQGENNLFEEFAVVLTDVDGSTASNTLSVKIVDDIVDAVDDPARTVVEGAAAIGGNVITDNNSGRDIPGADGASLIEVNFGSGFVAITSGTSLGGGTYQFIVLGEGTYTFNASGAWTFAPATNVSNGAADFPAGFDYKLRDGDGDIDTATQLINIQDGNGPGEGGNVALTLSEAALDLTAGGSDLAAGTATGSTPASAAETQVVTAANGLHFSAGSDAITTVAFGSLAGISVSGLQAGYTLSWSVNGSGQLVGTLFNGSTSLGTAILVALTGETSGAAAGDTADIGVTATLVGPLEHAYPNAAQGPISISGIQVRAAQADGDSNVGTISISVADDTPTAAIAIGAGEVRHDETPGVQVDTDSAVALDFSWVSNAGDDIDVAGTGAIGFAQSSYTVASTGSSYGADGAGTTVVSLLVNSSVSGLKTTEGSDIFLVQVGDKVEGRVGSTTAGSPVAFALQINGSGQVEVAQYLSLRHPTGGTASPDEVAYLANGALSARVTVTDGDGDVSIANVSLDGKIGFEDDGPSAVAPQAASLANNAAGLFTGTIDGNGIADNTGADGGTAQFSSNLALYPTGLTSGGQPITFSVSTNGQNLTATAGGLTVFTATITGNSYTIDMDRAVDSLTNVQFTDANYDFIGGNKGWFGIVPNGENSTPIDNNSKDVLITPIGGLSVNTSGILGGVDTGQSVGPGEGFRLDYVIDLRGSPPNDYSSGQVNGQIFDQHWLTNGASVSFRQSGGTTLRFQAFDDDTSAGNTNQIVGDGGQDTINGVVITYNSVASVLLTPTATAQQVTLSGRTFTFYLDSDGKSLIVENVGGASGNSGPPETTVSIFTATQYNSLEVEHVSGDEIKFSGFGAAVPSTAPVNFNLPVVVVDGDGDVSTAANIAVTLTSATAPVTLDLDGDGKVSYLGREAGVTFDYNGDGQKEATAWVGSGDGILVLDQNGNALVDNASEFVFGDSDTTDLAALRAHYGDVLDASDADFGKFAVWQDANGNAVADAGEVKSLAALGISSIDLVGNGQPGSAANGDVIVAGSTSFVRNGATSLAQDAIFKTGSNEVARSSDSGVLTTASLVAAAAAAAALAAAPAAAHAGPPAEAPGKSDDAPAASGGSPSPQAIEAAAGAASVVAGTPAADNAAPQASHAEPVQHFGGAQQVGIDSGEPIGTASGSDQLDHGTELAAHAPAFFAGGGEIHLPAPADMAALAAMAQPGEGQAQAALAQVLADALSGGGISGKDIDQLIDAAVKIAGQGEMTDGATVLADHLATPLAATVPGWDAGDFGPLFAGGAAAMETHALHPDAVQPAANG